MRYRIPLIAGLAALAACGGSESPSSPSSPSNPNNPGTPTPAVVATVVLSGTASVEIGKTVKLSAEARDAAGVAISGKTFTWSSASEAVATVASDGTVTGKTA